MASIKKRGKYWFASWRDANGNQHSRSTGILINDPKRGELLCKQDARGIAEAWERFDRGDDELDDCQQVINEIAARREKREAVKDCPVIRDFFCNHLLEKIERKTIGGETAKLRFGYLTSFLDYLGTRITLPLKTINHDVLQSWVDWQTSQGYEAGSVHKSFEFVDGVLNPVIKLYWTKDPTADIKLPAVHKTKRRPWEPKEIKAILKAAYTYVKGLQWVSAILFATFTGMRLSDAVRIRWDMLHLEPDEEYVDFTQHKLAHLGDESRVALHEELVRWLKYIKKRQNGGEWVTPDLAGRESSNLSAAFKKICQKAGIDLGVSCNQDGILIAKVGFHSFRRFVASLLNDLGVPEAQRKALLGHASDLVHEKYSKSRMKGIRKTVAKLPAVASGVVPLAASTKPDITSAAILPDQVVDQFAEITKLYAEGKLTADEFSARMSHLQQSVQTAFRDQLNR